MIIVTVGSQLPFNRLIKMVDEVAPSIGSDFFAQTGPGTYTPKNIRWSSSLSPSKFDELLLRADTIISHAGIGTVLKAYSFRKPIILVPRRASLNEHRNEHQLATVQQLRDRVGIYVAEQQDELLRLLSAPLHPPSVSSESEASKRRLQEYVRNIINSAKT